MDGRSKKQKWNFAIAAVVFAFTSNVTWLVSSRDPFSIGRNCSE